MNWEMATFGMSLAVLVLQGWNLYVSTRIKLWTTENFVSKRDYYRQFPHAAD